MFDKAVIFYKRGVAPWGIMKVIDVSVSDYLQDTSDLCKIKVTEKDSLQFILECINRNSFDTLKSDDYIDTSIAMLLFSNDKVDTLANNGFPNSRIQYNNMVFRDSALIYYILDAIREKDTLWNTEALDYYYNGTYNNLPKSLFKQQ